MKRLLLVLLCVSTQALGQTPLKSFAFKSAPVACSGNDQLMPLTQYKEEKAPPAQPGAGDWPTGVFYIRIACITHYVQGSQIHSFAVVGHSGPNGDHTTPLLIGNGTLCSPVFDPPIIFTPGEYLDLHAGCTGEWHWASMQVWYYQR
jgi:hypothetical protein